jgi:hypothetical protein
MIVVSELSMMFMLFIRCDVIVLQELQSATMRQEELRLRLKWFVQHSQTLQNACFAVTVLICE